MKILLVGSADLSGKTVGGQLEKTRIFYQALCSVKYYDVHFINMFAEKKSQILLRIILRYFSSDAVVFLTSENGTRLLINVLHILKKITYKPSIFVAVGNPNKVLQSVNKNLLNDIDIAFFETERMAADMKKILPGCTGCLTNCKSINTFYRNYHMDEKPIRICYYSEISKRKGFDTVIQILDRVNKEKKIYELDVYGYFGDDKAEMETYLKRSYVSFKNMIKRGEAASVLSQYFVMLFLTRHPQEGVPGAVVDAFEAGLPVIANDISYMKDIVKDGETGYILKAEDELEKKLLEMAQNMKPVIEMRQNCVKEARKYDISNAVNVFNQKMIEICS